MTERAEPARLVGRRRGGATRWILTGLVLIGCRGDGSAPALHTAAVPVPEAEPVAEAGVPAEAPAAPGRNLWFASGPGREAILARERRDHDAARALLDALLATELDADARGAAELLRALEHLEQGEHAAAAERFEAARGTAGLAPIELRLRRWEAQARLDAGQPDQARRLLGAVDSAVWAASAVGGDVRLLEADARARTDDPAGAADAYRAYLREHASGPRRFEARAKLARLLATQEDPASRREALALYDELRASVPLSDYADEAESAIPALERELGTLRTGAEAAAHERELAVARAEAQLDRHRHATAIKAVDALVAKGKLDPSQRCRVWYVKGSAIFKQRRRADARGPFERADKECDKAIKGAIKTPAGNRKQLEDLRVKARYQAARGLYAEGKYTKAGQAFEAIAAEHPKHSYADDALVLAGESWESHGDAERAATAYRRALEEHPGDMQHEARRRLLVMRFAAGATNDALALIDAALAKDIDHPVERSKLLYFRGRALERLGRSDEATTAWIEALDAAPLDYPALQALSRLRERGSEALQRGLARLTLASSAPSPADEGSKGSEAMRRAEVLARLGLGDEARDELRHGGIDGWPSIAVLDQAGLHPAAQIELANLGLRWRSTPPGDCNRWRWTHAHPRPFLEIIGPKEPEHHVPSLLTYAIMQTESRFDPGVTSFAGARGLVQLMPSTARGLAKGAGVHLDGDDALYDPSLNLDLGMRYLGRLTARYRSEDADGDGAVALAIPSYNAGAGAVDRWLAERGSWDLDLFIESIPYDETRKYTQSVLGRWLAYRWLYGEGEPNDRLPYLPLTTPRKQ
ncbi:transglycosylase SLT domain-containing protein [Paraliomyxa miuraensis]|uniref:transglycosylase SLT domain-containing protein n=1 Tax=Paraliomyxa miuraensis TaxID=376150 RepID=UPI002258D50E|nr:transglycosylase SLT domain-containing protein [Paraliomyxa miuraensis]MCX4244830.1 tetratricopeptide repeat protein [Paraliomyxa miuraensis]